MSFFLRFTQSLLGFKEKKTPILQYRNSMLKMLLIFNIPNIFILYLVNIVVSQPYMDEYFHYDQFSHYAKGDFFYWNPKITTPPGLYIVQFILSKIFGTSLFTLRAINCLLFGSLFTLFVVKIYEFHQRSPNNISRTLNLIYTPTIFFFLFLDYTDIASLTFMAMAYYYNLVNSHYRLAASSLLAIYTRQNNILWLGYLIIHKIITQYRTTFQTRRTFLGHTLNVVKIILNNKINILKSIRHQIIVIVIFFAYIYKYNDGKLVFGDHQHHQLSFHPTQILYLSLFIFLNVPIVLREYWDSVKATLYSLYYSKHVLASYLFMLSICIIIVDKWTVVHPFILSDNRHYIFYIYRYFFSKWFIRYSLCLFYPFCIIILVKTFVTCEEKMMKLLLWAIVTTLYLSVSQLVQVRYFAVPFLLYSLQIKNTNRSLDVQKLHHAVDTFQMQDKMTWTILIKICVNIFLLYIFIAKPFNEGQSRFMW